MSSNAASLRLADAERSLFIQWVTATVLGWALGFFVCETFIKGLSFGFSMTEGAVIGFFVGLLQGWVLRGQVGGMAWWFVASIVGFAVGKALGQGIIGDMAAPLGYVFTGGIIGFVVALPQGLVLRTRVMGALWWVLASTVGWAIGWSLLAAVNQEGISTVVTYIGGGVGAAAAGAVTAVALTWMLRASSEELG